MIEVKGLSKKMKNFRLDNMQKRGLPCAVLSYKTADIACGNGKGQIIQPEIFHFF